MKLITSNDASHQSVRIIPVLSSKHPSYRNPVAQAVIALRNLSEQYRMKNRRGRKPGHA